MQTKTVATRFAAEVIAATPVSRRRFLAGSTAAAAVASTLASGEISATEAAATDVTPALTQLFAQWQEARAELHRLSALDDEAAGCRQTSKAWEAQHDVMIRIEAEMERFLAHSNGDIIVLATLAQSFEDDGREFPEELAKSIIGHLLRLAEKQVT